VLEDVTQVDRYDDGAEELGEDADTGEVVLLFPHGHGSAAAELRARIAELQAENHALHDTVTELEEFNREAALARERMFMKMRRELARRQRAIESLDGAHATARSETDEARHRIGECEALLRERATELEQAGARIDELEHEVAARDNHAVVSEAYRTELETELDDLRAERDHLAERIRERDDDLEAARLAHHESLAELESRHRAELQRLHERAVRSLTLQWLALASSR
jgi:chromosome segregation ATPase